MKIMVTGGAGFIGSHLTRRLIDEGHKVVVVDDLSNGYRENVPKDAEFLELDLSSERLYDSLPTDVEVVYHLASQASGEISCEDPVHDLKANCLATLAILQWSKKNDVMKFIFTSSMGVYADQLGYAAVETSPLEPKSFYGVNKLASEKFIRIFSEEGMRTTVFRFFNVYGPGQNMENLKQGMVSIYMSYVLNDQPVCVKGPLDRTRDFTYISDVVEALYLGLNEAADGKLFNVCTGRELPVKEVLNVVFNAFDVGPEYPVEIYSRTPRDIDQSCGDYSEIQASLGWKPKVRFEDGVKSMSNWLKGEVSK